MSNLGNQFISASYQSVLNVGSAPGSSISSSQTVITDGYGTLTPLSLSTTAIGIASGSFISGSLIPETSGSFDLGTPAKPWRHIYASSGSIYLDEHQILSLTDSANNTAIAAPSGGTVNLVNDIFFVSQEGQGYEGSSRFTLVGAGNQNYSQIRYSGDSYSHITGAYFTTNYMVNDVNIQTGDPGIRIDQFNNNLRYENYNDALHQYTYESGSVMEMNGLDSQLRFIHLAQDSALISKTTLGDGFVSLGISTGSLGSLTPQSNVIIGQDSITGYFSNQADSSSFTLNNGEFTVAGNLRSSGTYYPNQIDVSQGSIAETTGSFVATFTNEGILTYDTYANVATALAPYISGSTGSSGTSGTSGTSGVNGSSGSSGTSGNSGSSGTSGNSGSSGTSGVNGSSGTSGNSGSSGTSGVAGSSGTSGTSPVFNSGSFAITGSNTFYGNQYVHGLVEAIDNNLKASSTTFTSSYTELGVAYDGSIALNMFAPATYHHTTGEYYFANTIGGLGSGSLHFLTENGGAMYFNNPTSSINLTAPNVNVYGQLYVSGSGAKDIILDGQMVISGSGTSAGRKADLTIFNTANGNLVDILSNQVKVSSPSNDSETYMTPFQLESDIISTGDNIGIQAGVASPNWSDGASIYVNNDGADSYNAVFGFQDKAHYTDGRITALFPMDISGSLNVTGGVTGSFRGDGSGLTGVTVSINTGSFATTGSNVFVGDQVVTGSLIVSGSGVKDFTVLGQMVISGSSGTTRRPELTIFNTSNGTYTDFLASQITLNDAANDSQTVITQYQVESDVLSTGDNIGIQAYGGTAPNWADGATIYVNNDAGDNYYAVFGFQDKAHYTNGAITALFPMVVSGSLTIRNGLNIASGSNKTIGTVALNGGNPGVATVSNSLVTANSLIFLTKQTNTNSGNGTVSVTSKGSSTFSITSDHNGDTDVVAYQIINPA
jgi:hypothetical protein